MVLWFQAFAIESVAELYHPFLVKLRLIFLVGFATLPRVTQLTNMRWAGAAVAESHLAGYNQRIGGWIHNDKTCRFLALRCIQCFKQMVSLVFPFPFEGCPAASPEVAEDRSLGRREPPAAHGERGLATPASGVPCHGASGNHGGG